MVGEGDEPPQPVGDAPWPPEGARLVDIAAHYPGMADAGIEYGPAFQGLTEVWRVGDELTARVSLPTDQAARYGLHPALLDAAFQAAAAGAAERRALLPFSFGAVSLWRPGMTDLRVRITADGDLRDLHLSDAAGNPVGRVTSLLARPPAAGNSALLSVLWSAYEGTSAGSTVEPTVLSMLDIEAGDDPVAGTRLLLGGLLHDLRRWLADPVPGGSSS
ncbi:polyketide synthase dehydratase domain-containing protein [Micromonospora sp. M12]